MNTGSQGKGPSVAELQKLVREKQQIELLLITGDKKSGFLRWFDDSAFCLSQANNETMTLLRSAVVGYQVIADQDKKEKKEK